MAVGNNRELFYEKATRYKEAIYLRDWPTKNEYTIDMKTIFGLIHHEFTFCNSIALTQPYVELKNKNKYHSFRFSQEAIQDKPIRFLFYQ
jgi:hypothetical protein